MKKRVTLISLLIATVVLTLVPIFPVRAEDTRLNPISGLDYDVRTFEYEGHVIAEGFAVSISADLPFDGSITQLKFGGAVARLGDTWDSTDGMNYYFKYTPYVDEMWLKVEGDSHYTKEEIAIYDNTGTGGSSCDFFSVVLEGIGLIFTAYDIYIWLAEIYQLPPVAEWNENGHWSKAIIWQKKEFAGNRWVVNPNSPRLQTASANVWGYFEEGNSYILNVTAQAEIYLQIWELWSGAIGEMHIGTYQVSFEVTVHPLWAMKTLQNGYFYVPNLNIQTLKIELLFDGYGGPADQFGGVPPYVALKTWPDCRVEGKDVSWVSRHYNTFEGDLDWDYMADIKADRKIDGKDLAVISRYYGTYGIVYIYDLSGVTVVFNTGQEITPTEGCVDIPNGATSFNVYKDGIAIGALITFWIE